MLFLIHRFSDSDSDVPELKDHSNIWGRTVCLKDKFTQKWKFMPMEGQLLELHSKTALKLFFSSFKQLK